MWNECNFFGSGPTAGSVPVSEANGDAGGVTGWQPEPMSFSGENRRKSDGVGRKRSQETAGHISRLLRNEHPDRKEGGSEWQAASQPSINSPTSGSCLRPVGAVCCRKWFTSFLSPKREFPPFPFIPSSPYTAAGIPPSSPSGPDPQGPVQPRE